MTSVLSDDERRTAKAAIASVRRSNPQAARILQRLVSDAARPIVQKRMQTLSVHQVATVFDVTDQTVRNWVDRGWMPAERFPAGIGPRRIPRSVLASASALSRPRPKVRDLSAEE